MNKHTPGPWTVLAGTSWIIAEHPAHGAKHGGMHIADVRGWGYLIGTGAANLPAEEATLIQDANARLIAAAPDLLEALKQACRILADEDVPDAALHPGDPLLTWKAAIAKAEGR